MSRHLTVTNICSDNKYGTLIENDPTVDRRYDPTVDRRFRKDDVLTTDEKGLIGERLTFIWLYNIGAANIRTYCWGDSDRPPLSRTKSGLSNMDMHYNHKDIEDYYPEFVETKSQYYGCPERPSSRWCYDCKELSDYIKVCRSSETSGRLVTFDRNRLILCSSHLGQFVKRFKKKMDSPDIEGKVYLRVYDVMSISYVTGADNPIGRHNTLSSTCQYYPFWLQPWKVKFEYDFMLH